MLLRLLQQRFLSFLSVTSLFNLLVQAEQPLPPGNATTSEMPCLFEHEDPWITLKLLDPNDGLPFINDNGVLRKTTQIPKSMPQYALERVQNAPPETYDLKLDNEYLALFDDGTLGFAAESSRGTKQVNMGGKQYMTTIFTISCNGDLSIALPDSINFGFAQLESSKYVYAHPETVMKHARSTQSHTLSFLERSMAATQNKTSEMISFSFLAGPAMINDHFQKGYAPRCRAQVPFGLQSMVKPGARAASFNGCGPENGMGWKLVPDLRFTDCCNEHDLCYDDCSMTWEECNDNFRYCNIRSCNATYPYPKNESWYHVDPIRWGCWQLADTYADAVGTRIGAWAFNSSNTERCECNCPTGTLDCGKFCMAGCEDISESGIVSLRKGGSDEYLIFMNELPGI